MDTHVYTHTYTFTHVAPHTHMHRHTGKRTERRSPGVQSQVPWLPTVILVLEKADTGECSIKGHPSLQNSYMAYKAVIFLC